MARVEPAVIAKTAPGVVAAKEEPAEAPAEMAGPVEQVVEVVAMVEVMVETVETVGMGPDPELAVEEATEAQEPAPGEMGAMGVPTVARLETAAPAGRAVMAPAAPGVLAGTATALLVAPAAKEVQASPAAEPEDQVELRMEGLAAKAAWAEVPAQVPAAPAVLVATPSGTILVVGDPEETPVADLQDLASRAVMALPIVDRRPKEGMINECRVSLMVWFGCRKV